MASAEGGSVPSGMGYGEGCSLPSRPEGLGERRELLQRGPGRKRILAYFEGHRMLIFTALHVMQTRSSDENSVCLSVRLSVRLSVTRVNCDKTVERSVQIYIPYERTFSLVF